MIELIRDELSQNGTHGTFKLGGKEWHSLEPPDLDNAPFKSCVPEGTYDLIPFDSPKYGPCFIMVNDDLNVFAFENSSGRPKGGRFLCLFVHRGNYVRNFVGCVGASHGYNAESDFLLPSTKRACAEVVRLVRDEGSYKLRISRADSD